MRQIITNKTYKHFKGNFYKVLYIAYDEQRCDDKGNPIPLVIYQSSHDGKLWVRTYENFAEKVDKEKYPNATQTYRFEEVD